MKALERYVKKNNKSMPYGKTKSKGSWEGPEGVKEKSQFAEKSGKKITDDSEADDETDPETAGIGAYESVRGYGTKKNKQRSYLKD